jgi:hypothetical protein
MDVNLMCDFVANGASVINQSHHEVSSMYNHYDCMGLYTLDEVTWQQLMYRISMCKHNLAFFYMLFPEKHSCLLGYNYLKYCHLKNFSETRRSEYMARNRRLGTIYSEGDYDVDVKFHIGGSKRYKQFMIESNIPTREEVSSYFEQNAALFLQKPRNHNEVRYKIYEKAHSTGATKAFSFETSSKQHAACAYLFHTKCIQLNINGEQHKTNLFGLLKILLKSDQEFEPSLFDFPNMKFYDDFMESFSITIEKKFLYKKRRIPFKCSIPDHMDIAPCSLLSVVKWFWFGMQVRDLVPSLVESFKSYKEIIPWLRDDFKSSLQEYKDMTSQDCMTMIDIIKNFGISRRVMSVMHKGSIRHGRYDALFQSIASIYDINSRLRLIDLSSSRSRYLSLKNVSTKLYNLSTSPPMSITRDKALAQILSR